MQLLPMEKLGPREQQNKISFGVLLPGVTPSSVQDIRLKVIHEKDQLLERNFDCFEQQMKHSSEPGLGDYWSTTIDLAQSTHGNNWGNSWGEPGRYLYRFTVTPAGSGQAPIDWLMDPFSREFGPGRHSAFTYGYSDHPWSVEETQWRVPRHKDLVMYEMNIAEFAGSLKECAKRLQYLTDLGINCLSLMPVTNISDAMDWGYTPIGYFGVDERFGERSHFQEFVDEAHKMGIAVIVDAIYGHTSSLFPYEYLYSKLGIANPVMGPFADNDFGPSTDWNKELTQNFFYTVNRHWLEKYHVDGFRYDCVPNYWDPVNSRGYAAIAYATHQLVKAKVAEGDSNYMRFEDGSEPLRLIQCAEQLKDLKGVLKNTFSTCAWQNGTMSAAQRVASAAPGALVELGHAWGAVDVTVEETWQGDKIFKSPLQYIETHDQHRFICNFGTHNRDCRGNCPLDQNRGNCLFDEGERNNWYRVQPYLIGTIMSKGIPLLWQGQELCESSKVAPGGSGRTGFLRIVRWEYFYDHIGQGLHALVRKLLAVRRSNGHIRDGEHFFFDSYDRYHQNGVMLFARYYPGTDNYTLIALNFTGEQKRVPFWFPLSGNYREELNGTDRLNGVTAYSQYDLDIPSNYGRIWTFEG